jgi:hypothetical protein
MSFRPGALREVGGTATNGDGVISYRLARQRVIDEFTRGRLSRQDVCDAHPELRRAAAGAGQPTGETCPICQEGDLALVTYAFGLRLPAGGRCVTTTREMARLEKRRSVVTCYVVEVCADCAWNHLTRVFQIGGK